MNLNSQDRMNTKLVLKTIIQGPKLFIKFRERVIGDLCERSYVENICLKAIMK